MVNHGNIQCQYVVTMTTDVNNDNRWLRVVIMITGGNNLNSFRHTKNGCRCDNDNNGNKWYKEESWLKHIKYCVYNHNLSCPRGYSAAQLSDLSNMKFINVLQKFAAFDIFWSTDNTERSRIEWHFVVVPAVGFGFPFRFVLI